MKTQVIFSLCLAPLLLNACHSNSRYLGNTRPPSAQRLVYVDTYEPTNVDPAQSLSAAENNITECLFEGLTLHHPFTGQPMAGIATHYEVSTDGEQYTFYLRGHRAPKGARLADISSLPRQFSRGVKPPPDSMPARWSDGSIITADDFVYSWQRLADPRTASPNASETLVILHAREILRGKSRPEQLSVDAPGEFVLHVRLEAPTPYLLGLLAMPCFMPVPRQAVLRAALRGRPDSWARPGNIVSNGPFVLAEWRPYDHLTIKRSPTYYEAGLVKLDEIWFPTVTAGPSVLNLYRAGLAQSLFALPSALIPALGTKQDFRQSPSLVLVYATINLRRPPFDNRMLRWAVNMALDKRAIAGFLPGTPAPQLMPPMPDFTPPESSPVKFEGKQYDVLAYNPQAARELLSAAGYPGGIGPDGNRLIFLLHAGGSDLKLPEIIRNQLLSNLNIEAQVIPIEQSVASDGIRNGTLEGLTIDRWGLDYADPYALLGPLFAADWLGWHSEVYSTEVAEANGTLDPAARMQKLSQCAARLMQAMPLIPLAFGSNITLTKPYVRALQKDLTGHVSFRYAWIDADWKPDTGWKP
jgi:ABC-type oligopeptide transport system substrate-binding subunit